MNYDTKLEAILKASFDLQAQRITAIRMFTKAAIVTRSLDSTQLSLAMNPSVDVASNAKRIGRLLEQVTLSAADKQHFILGNQPLVRVSFDRTEWDFGSVTNNLLTAAVEVNGLAVPIHTKDLGQCGSSSDDARIKAVDDTLNVVPADRIEVFTADREFASTRFIAHLLEKRISFAIRLKCDALIEHKGVRLCGSAWFTEEWGGIGY